MVKPDLNIQESVLSVRNALLLENAPKTYLTAAAAAGDTTLTVENIADFAVSGYLIFSLGTEEFELVQVHASTAPSGSTITLAAALARSHPRDTAVYQVSFNQVEFSRATTSGGSKTILSTVTIQGDREATIYDDTTNSTGYAYARFKNSTTSTYSQYSDEQAYKDLEYNSVGAIIDQVFSDANERSETFITRAEVLGWVKKGIARINDLRTRYNHEESDTDMSQSTTTGGEIFALPSTIKFDDNRGIMSVSLSGGAPLKPWTWVEFLNNVAGLARGVLNGAVLAAATSITLYDASLFSSTGGTAYIDGDSFSWTGITGNTLTGVTGLASDHASGAIVSDEGILGEPTHFTVLNGTGHLFPPVDADNASRVIQIDFYSRLTYPTSENTLLPLPYVSPIQTYCMKCFQLKKENAGMADRYDRDFMTEMATILRNEKSNQPKQLSTKE